MLGGLRPPNPATGILYRRSRTPVTHFAGFARTSFFPSLWRRGRHNDGKKRFSGPQALRANAAKPIVFCFDQFAFDVLPRQAVKDHMAGIREAVGQPSSGFPGKISGLLAAGFHPKTML
jgi:hypothetical protein